MTNDTKQVDDRQIMQWWRECGLDEWFLGNGGTNAKLAAFAERVRQEERERIKNALSPFPVCELVAQAIAFGPGHAFQDRDAWEKTARSLEARIDAALSRPDQGQPK